MSRRNRAVLVTGGSRGIGRATAEAFLTLGDRVAINDRSFESVEMALSEIGETHRLFGIPGDVSTARGCQEIVAEAVLRLGGLDILVNNAGVFMPASISESSEELWDTTIDTNVKGTFFCSRAAAPALTQSQGAIVNLASEAGLRGYKKMTVYCASKGAVVNLTRAMARELAPAVRVNCVCPGIVETDMTKPHMKGVFEGAREFYPLGRFALASEIAAAIVYLASAEAKFVTGTALSVDGGASA